MKKNELYVLILDILSTCVYWEYINNIKANYYI